MSNRDGSYTTCSVCRCPNSALFNKELDCYICEGCLEDSADATRASSEFYEWWEVGNGDEN